MKIMYYLSFFGEDRRMHTTSHYIHRILNTADDM